MPIEEITVVMKASYPSARILHSPAFLGTATTVVLQLTAPRSRVTRVVTVAANLWIVAACVRFYLRPWWRQRVQEAAGTVVDVSCPECERILRWRVRAGAVALLVAVGLALAAGVAIGRARRGSGAA